MRISGSLVACLLLLLGLVSGGCRSPRLKPAHEPDGGSGAAASAPPRTQPPTLTYAGPPSAPPRRDKIGLRPADLVGVESWLSKENQQWILGDVVDVYASKEYFARVLTMNAKVGLVQRTDRRMGDDLLVTMTYMGHPGSASAMTNPRVQIGSGLSVSARRVLRVRMAKTRDGRRPVQLRVVAHGKAAAGRHEEVRRRGEQLELGGMLRHDGWRWVWRPVGG